MSMQIKKEEMGKQKKPVRQSNCEHFDLGEFVFHPVHKRGDIKNSFH